MELCLVDEVTFEVIGEPYQLRDAAGLEIPECILRVTWTDPSDSDDSIERFVIGTSITPDSADITAMSRGRIIILGVDKDRKFQLAGSHPLNSACHCLARVGSSSQPPVRIVAGLSSSVAVYDYDEPSDMKGRLHAIAKHRSSTCPQDIAVHGNLIAVADIMKSLTILEFTPRAEDGTPAKLTERARHMQEAWTTAVCHVDGDSWLQADAMGQLMVLRERTDGATKQDRKRMELTSALNLGEQVNRIRALDVPMDANSVIWPKAFLGTVSWKPPPPSSLSSPYTITIRFKSKR